MSRKRSLTSVLHLAIALSFVLGALVVAPAVSADPGTSKWEKQTTPTEEDLVILPGSDIIDFDVASDGETIYAIGIWYDVGDCEVDWTHQGGPHDFFCGEQFPRLWKSTDAGVTWKDKTSKVLDAKNLPDLFATGWTNDAEDFSFFSAVSVAPDDPGFVVVTGWGFSESPITVDGRNYNWIPVVVGSNDGADKFYYIGCETAFGMITCVDVSMEVDGKHSIAIGTWDWEQESTPIPPYQRDLATVWRYDAGGYWSAYWDDTSDDPGWEPCDAIIDLEFSPNFDVDDTLVVLCIDDVEDAELDSDWGNDENEAGTGDDTYDYLGFKVQAATWNSIDAWNSQAEFDGYPVTIRNDDYEIVSPIDPELSSWSIVAGWWDEWGEGVRHAGDLELPMDYMGDDTSDRKFVVAVNGFEFNMSDTPDAPVDDGGFLFWVENTTISLELLDHEDNPYISSIDYHGNIDMEGKTMVGCAFPKGWGWAEADDWLDEAHDQYLPCCEGVPVLYSETTDVCCPDWDWSCKPPSGQFFATVMMTPDGDWAFAATQGEGRLNAPVEVSEAHHQGAWCDESAFSVSGHVEELGDAWNQTALIDTDIDFISDVAVTSNGDGDDECSPSCACIYLATINRGGEGVGARVDDKILDCDSIWRSCDDGETWLRIWHAELQGEPLDPGCTCDWPHGFRIDVCGSSVEWMVLGLVPGEEEPAVIYMADLGTETIWHSSASGDACCPAGLGCWTDRNTGLGWWYDPDPASATYQGNAGDKGIADMAVLDADTVYVVAFNGDMVKTTSKGRHWSSQVDTKVDDDTDGEFTEQAHDIIAWSDWILVGGDMGTVSYSDDGGDSFSVLDDIGDGQVHLAFDSYFDDNAYIYAAVACGNDDNGVYRTTVDDADFEDMGACKSLDYWAIALSNGDANPMTSASSGGVLYATYTSWNCFSGWCTDSGVARILNPASQICCDSLSWDYLFAKLSDYADFCGQPATIALCGDASGGATTIWAIDLQSTWYNGEIWQGTGAKGNSYYGGWDDCYESFSQSDVGRLWTYNDVFGKGGPQLIGVPDGATIPSDPCDCVNEDFILEWDRLCDACEYDIEIALDEGFRHKVWTTSMLEESPWNYDLRWHDACTNGLLYCCEREMPFYKPSDPCAPSIVVPQGVLDCNQTYWWRVRARAAETDEVYRSWWSDKWSFTVAVGPDGAIRLTAPVNGAMNVPLGNVVFTWTAVADADNYEMVLMDASGAELASNSGDATSFVLTSDLDWDSAYMWMVKAMKGSNVLSESGVSTFHTMSKPVPPPEYPETVINFPEPAPTPTWVWVVIALAAILIIVVIVLVFRTRRV